MEEIKKVFDVIKREILNITHDVNITSVILLAPLFYAFFYSSVYINKIETEIPIGVVDYDNSNSSQKLCTDINFNQIVEVAARTTSYEEAKLMLEHSEIQGFIVIPKGFEADLKQYKGTKIKLFLNTTRFLVSNDLNKAINEVIFQKALEYRQAFYKKQGYSLEQATELSDPVQLDMRPLYNTTESYGDFILPGLLALILHQTLLIGLAESIAKEREENSIKEWYKTAGYSTYTAIIGKTAFYFVLFCAYAFFFYTVNYSMFSLNIVGSYNVLAFLTILYILAVIFMSVFIASFFERKIISLQVFAFTSIPFFLISGYSYPLQAMPVWMQILSSLLPSTIYLNAQVRLTQMGASVTQILPEIIQLFIFVVISFFAAFFRMKYLFNQKQVQNN